VGVSTPRRPPVPYRPPQTDRLEPILSPAAVLPSGSTRGPCRAPHCRFRPPTAARASPPRRPPALTPRTICPSPYPGEARWGSPLRDGPSPYRPPQTDSPQAHLSPTATLPLDSTRGPPSTRHMPILGSPPPLETGAPFNRGMRTQSSTPPKKTKEPPHCCDGSSARKRS